MARREVLDRLVRAVAAQIRWRRVEHYALRAGFYGVLAGLVPLFAKSVVGPWALTVAAIVVGIAVVVGGVYGFAKTIPTLAAAAVADRAFGLHDGVATALEWGDRADRSPLVECLVADAEARVGQLSVRQVVGREWPREARWLPFPIMAALVLAWAPSLPLPAGRLPDFSQSGEREPSEERPETAMLEDTPRPAAKTPLTRSAIDERDMARRGGAAGPAMAGDLSAVFKDTSLAAQRPDFNSFLRKGDERLRILEHMDRLPDLQSDFTSSQYKMIFRKSKALTGGLRPDQLSPQKLRELLEEMERLGRKGGNWTGEVSEGMEALESGQQDRALEAMERALSKMRAMEDQQRAGRTLRGGREGERGGRGDRGRRGAGGGSDEQDFGEGEGFMPGRGRSQSPKGEPTQRLRADPYDVGVEGESRSGRKTGYDTNMTGRGSAMESRLRYRGVIGQYRKMMEDAIAREQVPRDYQGQIKDYFQSLEER